MVDVQTLERVVIRFAGDSGDGMQLTGDRFTADSASYGNDISTLPNFPAEIRAPQGTLAGVSSFQVHFASTDIVTPGDKPDALVAMNPAALKANLHDIRRGGLIIADSAEFTKRNLAKVGFASDPLTDGSLANYQVIGLDLTGMAVESVKEFGLGRKEAARAKNMFALGLVSWLYNRPRQGTLDFLATKFAKNAAVRDANIAAFNAGHAFGETTEAFAVRYEVPPASLPAGLYRQISGNLATAYGLVVGAHKAGLQLFLGSYPITPASDILHALSSFKAQGVMTFQAEDEIAGAGSALGASYAGALGVTTTSGPGMALKSETISLAIMTELPLVIVDVQRAGPSTGLPTKTEQADLFQALYGRHGEAPLPVLAAKSPADCFDTAVEACRIAVTYRTPVIMLSDAYNANGAEPWLIPDIGALAPIAPHFATDFNGEAADGTPVFLPYKRDPRTGGRAWALPGTPKLEHRIGGLEKSANAGAVSYDPINHERMVHQRADKVAGIVRDVPDVVVDDPSGEATLLVIGWGSTYGPITAAARRVRASGRSIAQVHVRHLNPLPANLGEVLRRYERVVVPEMNLGQFATVLRSTYLVDAEPLSKVQGLPFSPAELAEQLEGMIDAMAVSDADDVFAADSLPGCRAGVREPSPAGRVGAPRTVATPSDSALADHLQEIS